MCPARPCYTLGGTGVNYHLHFTDRRPYHLMAATLASTLAGVRPQPSVSAWGLGQPQPDGDCPRALSFKFLPPSTPVSLVCSLEAREQLSGVSSPPCRSRGANSRSQAWQQHFGPLSRLTQQFVSNENSKYLLQKESLVCWDWELDEHSMSTF